MVDNISKIFDVAQPPPQQIVTQPKPELPPDVIKADQQLQDDFASSIEDYTTLMDQGKAALEEILTIASQSQNARFFEAGALMIKTLADTNAGRMDVHHKLHQIKKIKQDLGIGGAKTTIQKAVFVGSTSDLLKQVKPRIIDVVEETVVYEEEDS